MQEELCMTEEEEEELEEGEQSEDQDKKSFTVMFASITV